MYFYILLFAGIFLIGVTPYIFVKTKKHKDTNFNHKKTYKGILSILLIGIAFVGLAFVIRTVDKPKEAIQFQIPLNVNLGPFAESETNQNIINSVFYHFAERIQGESKVEKIDIALQNYKPSWGTYRQDEYGWYKEIEIVIKIADDDKTIYGGVPMMGNNLFYHFGGGENPGMIISKEQSFYFYGFKKNEFIPGRDAFFADDFYKIIDGLELK